jgi:hypothetical protein
MIIYLGFGAEDKADLLVKGNCPHSLVSYFYIKEQKIPFSCFDGKFKKVMLDSGAFSADSLNKPISIEEYADFALKNKALFETIINLDVIGDKIKNQNSAELSIKNQQYLESRGLKPIPVFHQTEDLKYLDWYAERYDYIGLGGVGNLRNPKWIGSWLYKVFKRHPKKKYHGFAITSPQLIIAFPFYSVDSTSWSIGARYGQVIQRNKFGTGFTYRRAKIDYKTIIDKYTNPLSLLDIGGDKRHNERNLENVKEFVKLEDTITRLWEKEGVIWQN